MGCVAVDVSMVFHLLGEVIDRSCKGRCVVMWDFSVYSFVICDRIWERYTIVHIIKIELLAPRDRVSSQL